MTLFDLDTITTDQGTIISHDSKESDKKSSQKLIMTRMKIEEVFGDLNNETDLHYITAGAWSTHDLIDYIIDKIGPAELTACTWSVSSPAHEKLIKMLNLGKITKLNMLLDWRIHQRGKGVAVWLKQYADNFKVSNCHAKVSVLESKTHAISIVGSANWTNNPRIECGILSTSPQIAQFHKNWIMTEIQRPGTIEGKIR